MPTTTDRINEEKRDWNKPDDLLAGTVRIVDENDVSIDITVVAEGILLTGTAVSGREYTLALGELMANMKTTDSYGRQSFVHDDNGKARTRAIYEEIANEKYPLKVSQQNDANHSARESEPVEVVYIHLRDVQLVASDNGDFDYSGSGFPYWRFRLSQISGWTFGRSSRD